MEAKGLEVYVGKPKVITGGLGTIEEFSCQPWEVYLPISSNPSELLLVMMRARVEFQGKDRTSLLPYKIMIYTQLKQITLPLLFEKPVMLKIDDIQKLQIKI